MKGEERVRAGSQAAHHRLCFPHRMKSPLTRRARALRQDMTPHEVRLWTCLRAWRSEGIKFRRQVPLGRYIVDFACFRPKLVVELDGGQHTLDDHAAKDARRDAWLRSEGFIVFRAWNHEVDDNIDAVLDAIRALVDEARQVLPLDGEGGPKERKG
jgi:very-short-patch-repair endonuclease